MNMIRPKYFKSQKPWEEFEKIINNYIKFPLNELSTNLIFDWISQLYQRQFFNDEEYLKNLIFIVPDINESNIKRILDILNEISSSKKCKKNTEINNNIIQIILCKLNECPDMINTFGITIIKELIKTINIENLFEEISNFLLNQNDIYFSLKMINMLNKFLITEEESNEIRVIISKFGNEGKNEKFFEKIFSLWLYNPFCTLILVLLSNSFELGYFLIVYISNMKLKAEDYIELAQFVQVFESPIFNNIRIKLLNPTKYTFLIETLYAVLLLLPQGQAFEALSCRLKCLEIIFNLDEQDEEIEDDDISSLNEFEKSNQRINLNFNNSSSDSICSNFELSSKSINNIQKEYNKLFPFESKRGSILLNRNKLLDKQDDELFEKKGLLKYINIFKKAQNRKKEFENRVNESGQIRQICYSPTYCLKKK